MSRLSGPPLANTHPPTSIYGHVGGSFSKNTSVPGICNNWQTRRMLPFLGEIILSRGNSSILVLSDHFWRINADLLCYFQQDRAAFVILWISAETQYWLRSFVACKCQYQTDHPLSLLQRALSTCMCVKEISTS